MSKKKAFFCDILTLEYGTNTVSQNIGYKPADTVQQPRGAKISTETTEYL
jgi:hypothetical protein